jgi:hypothetical protein
LAVCRMWNNTLVKMDKEIWKKTKEQVG